MGLETFYMTHWADGTAMHGEDEEPYTPLDSQASDDEVDEEEEEDEEDSSGWVREDFVYRDNLAASRVSAGTSALGATSRGCSSAWSGPWR